MKMVLLILAFLAIALFDAPKLIKAKKWKKLVVFSGFFLTAFIMGFLLVLRVNIPSPILAIQHFIEDTLHLHY